MTKKQQPELSLDKQQLEIDKKNKIHAKNVAAFEKEKAAFEKQKADFETKKDEMNRIYATNHKVMKNHEVAVDRFNLDVKEQYKKINAEYDALHAHQDAHKKIMKDNLAAFEKEKADFESKKNMMNRTYAANQKVMQAHEVAVAKFEKLKAAFDKAVAEQADCPGLPQYWINFQKNGVVRGLSFEHAWDIAKRTHGSSMWRAEWEIDGPNKKPYKTWRCMHGDALYVNADGYEPRTPARIYTDHLFTKDWVVQAPVNAG